MMHFLTYWCFQALSIELPHIMTQGSQMSCHKEYSILIGQFCDLNKPFSVSLYFVLFIATDIFWTLLQNAYNYLAKTYSRFLGAYNAWYLELTFSVGPVQYTENYRKRISDYLIKQSKSEVLFIMYIILVDSKSLYVDMWFAIYSRFDLSCTQNITIQELPFLITCLVLKDTYLTKLKTLGPISTYFDFNI